MATSEVLATAHDPASQPVTDPPAGTVPLHPTDVATPTVGGATGRYSLLLTRETEYMHAAQRLRYDVFAGEQGARLAPSEAADAGRDEDRFDRYCDHLVVREDATGAIVGTYRMLGPEGARAAGGLYSDTEFDLHALDDLRSHTVEVGRSCVHPDHRSGTVLSLVWAGIGRYLLLTGHRYLVGCASVPLTADGELPAAVWSLVQERHLAPAERRVTPRHAAPVAVDDGSGSASGSGSRGAAKELPPLLRGYLRLGAQIGGPPALDPDFWVGDLFVLLDHEAVDPRWRRHLLGEG